MSFVPNPALIRSVVQSGIRRLRSDRAVTSELTADVVESEDELTVQVDAPGVEEEDIQVRYLTDEVLIRMDRFRGPRDGFSLDLARRPVGFDGRVPLPPDFDVEPKAASATLRTDGTLAIRLPKVVEGTDERDEPIVAAIEDDAQ